MTLAGQNKTMEYLIHWSEKKTTSTGKEKIDATLKEASGAEYKGVTIWADFPGFATLMTGNMVTGNIVTKQNGQYTNSTLYPIKPTGQTPMRSAGAITKAMERKETSIKGFQENKEEGIKTSSCIRMASELAIAQGNATQENVLKLREWYWKNWEVTTDNSVPF